MKKFMLSLALAFGFLANANAGCDEIPLPGKVEDPTVVKQAARYSGAHCNIPTVIITGHLPRHENGFRSIWTSSFPAYYSPSGGGGGHSGSFWHDDGTRGWGDIEWPKPARTQPGCVAEQLFMAAIAVDIANTHGPVGTFIPLDLQDDRYKDGNWRKYEVHSGITHQITNDNRRGHNFVTKKRIVVHYMYNIATQQVDQMKFKNSYEAGCLGVRMPAGG
jgi:hypothetical protein